jgi:Xaa-Pro aminopeptidase
MITASEFQVRRQRLQQQIGPAGVAVIAASGLRARNRDTEFPFRQDSDFFYLTGFNEPDAVAVLVPGRGDGEFVMFCRPRDPEKEIWSGRRLGPQGVMAQLGVDQAFTLEELDAVLPGLLDQRQKLYYRFGADDAFDMSMKRWLRMLETKSRAGSRPPREIVLLDNLLHEQRLLKSPEEIAVMRAAAAVAVSAHQRAMRSCKPGMMEYEIEAEILHEFRRAGAVPAYNSIVGGGANACILHYIENHAKLINGDLLLIDAGAELHTYASDITRTFPVNGKFTGEQRALYEIVLQAQLAAIAATRVGNHFMQPHEAAVRVLTEGLLAVGILQGERDDLIAREAYKPFYMHRTGHWLGMDVHDVGAYKPESDWRALVPGMVTTVEPGLYIQAGAAGVDERWWNIGIRIEDDVVVTAQGPDVLTAAAPKSIDDIEALMRGG